MSALIPINDVNVCFKVVDDKVFCDTLHLAKVFGKNHHNILQAIKNLANDDFKSLNFKESVYINLQNKRQPCYNLTRDGFSLLVMGFTGAKAYRWKIEFIKAFNAMEAKLNHLKHIEQSNRIANLQAIQISQAKHHANQLNGYKSTFAKQKSKLEVLKAELVIANDKAKNPDIKSNDELKKRLEHLVKCTTVDAVCKALRQSEKDIIDRALKIATDDFMSNLHLLKG
ncbi:phage regulatory protein, Rha family [Campylobacter iguaniorum]|uniref:Rha family transcriptional regulator n=1 Tax=Campylobacter iguaniorum TaxID=1244531 RepID=UPI00073A4D1F|nr:Rha family transcriptional regulator [Campylobacter iguaniorum]ALV25075.1 phage regulatory protein, Rha family [Campylobacter iguaniorum]